MRRIIVSMIAAVAVVGLTQTPTQAVEATECTTTLTGGTYDRLVVPEGATCTLEDVTVNGNVRVLSTGALFTYDSTINGSVRGDGARTVRLFDTDIVGTGTSGNVNLTGTLGRIIIGNLGCKIDPAVGNNITLIDNLGGIGICQMTVGETITLQGNDKNIGVFHNTTGNSLIIQGNTGDFTRVRANDVGLSGGGSIIVQDNESQVRLRNNHSANSFNCSGNVPDPTGYGNTADNSMNGQCASLG